jgi:hypothetical protein
MQKLGDENGRKSIESRPGKAAAREELEGSQKVARSLFGGFRGVRMLGKGEKYGNPGPGLFYFARSPRISVSSTLFSAAFG